jgi:hypothetical protein
MVMIGYWMNETSGVLRPIVERYLNGGDLDDAAIAIMRAYLPQWMEGEAWFGAAMLRTRVAAIATTADLRDWLNAAAEIGVDPL